MNDERRHGLRQLDLQGGRTNVFHLGDGPPTLMVHGGPGMEHNYLRQGLSFLEEFRSVYYYDQVGTGTDQRAPEDATITSLRAQLQELYSFIKAETSEPITILAHSWGTLLTLLEEPWSEDDGVRVVMVSPMGLTWDRCVAAVGRFASRVSAADSARVAQLEALDTQESGIEEMELLMPYYVSPTLDSRPEAGILDYRASVNARVINSVSGYDVRANAERLPNRPIVIQGDYDFYVPEDVSLELPPEGTFVQLKGTGHFPFLERPKEFQDTLKGLLLTPNA